MKSDSSDNEKMNEKEYAELPVAEVTSTRPPPNEELFEAVKENFPEGVVAAIKRDANPNAKDKDGKTPIILAASKGYLDVVETLLQYEELNLNTKDHKNDWPALMWAICEGHLSVAKVLIQSENIDVTVKTWFGWTSLMWAAERGYPSMVRLLLEKGSLPQRQTNDHRTALMWAADKGHNHVVKAMLQYDQVDPNFCNQDGWTALIWAVEQEHILVVKVLLQCKRVQADVKDKKGRTALEIAQAKGRQDIAALFAV